MADIGYGTSRRSLLRALTVAPVATLPRRAAASPWDAAIAALPYHDEPVVLRRSRVGRSDSRFRYHNAESFFVGIERGIAFELAEFDLLAAILSPYNKWVLPQRRDRAADLPFTPERIRMLTRVLLDHVHHVTGHPRPRGWNARYA